MVECLPQRFFAASAVLVAQALLGCGPSTTLPSGATDTESSSTADETSSSEPIASTTIDGADSSGPSVDSEGAGSTTGSSTTGGEPMDSSTTGEPSTGSTGEVDPVDDGGSSTTSEMPPDRGCVLATWNPDDAQQNIVFSNGDLTATVNDDSVNDSVRATAGVSEGRWYFEVRNDVAGESGFNGVGLGDEEFSLEVDPCPEGLSCARNGFSCAGGGALLDSYGAGSVVGVAFDAETREVWVSINETWQFEGGPDSAPGRLLDYELGVALFPALNLSEGDVYTANFGQNPFVSDPPEGFFPGVCEP